MFWRKSRAPAIEERATVTAGIPIAFDPGYESLAKILGGENLPASVTYDEALKLPPVFSAINFFSNTLAALPLRIMQNGSEVKAHPIAGLLGSAASEDMTAFELRKLLHGGQFGPGRGYVQIERDRKGDPVGLYPMEFARTTPRRDAAGRVYYDYRRADGRDLTYRAGEVIDLAYMRLEDAVSSVCPVTQCASAIRQGLNAAQYALNTFGRNGIPPYVLQGPHGSGEAAERAAKDIARAARKAASENRPVLPIPTGFTLSKLGSDPDKMQLVPSQIFVVQQVARIYNLPPVFLQELSTGTYSNTEQQDLHLVKHTLTARTVQAGQELTLKLFGRGSDLSIEFDLQALTRGIFRDRIEALATGVNSGQITPNEARAMRGEPALPGGDQLFIQSGTVPIALLADKMRAEIGAAGQSKRGAE